MAMQMMMDAQEGSRQRKGLLFSALAHGVVLAFCYFFVKWSPPDPPLPDYGVELNFGVDAEGYGNIQSLAPANESEQTNATPGPPQENEPQPQQQATPPVVKTEEPEEVTSASTQEEDSPVEVPPKKEERKPEPVKEPVKQEPKPEAKPAPKPSIPAPPAYSSSTKPGGGGSGTASGTAGNNNGDRPGKTGDQGDRRGTLDGKALYGNPGSGTGSNLELAGWNWDSKPDKIDPFDEEGRIVFEIKVDEEGNLVDVKPIQQTVSPKVVQFYKNQVEALTFSRTRENASPAPISSGRITIIIRSR